MRTYDKFRGFTLVELLVVISIIGMLAGLLLPAIQAAREAGRRATCINNQSQVAFACLNFDSTNGYLPPLKDNPTGTYATGATTGGVDRSWIINLFPYIEQNKAWELKDFTIALPSFICRSSGISGKGVVSYIANAGSANGTDGAAENGIKDFAVFFDRTIKASYNAGGTATTSDPRCEAKVAVDYISQKDGTTVTLLLSEKSTPVAYASSSVGENAYGFRFTPTTATASIGTGNAATFSKWINEGKSTENSTSAEYARPSSNHPGVVIAAFVDRHVQVLSEDISKDVFARAMQVNSTGAKELPE